MSELSIIYPIEQSKQLIEVDKGLTAVDNSLQKVLATTQQLDKILKESGISFDKLNKAQKETEKTSKNLDTVGKQLESTQTKLKQLEDNRTASIIRNRAEIQKQTKNIKDLNRAKQAEKGSNEQLIAVNIILEKRLRNVNQTTDKGRKSADRLRSAIDKNNVKIKTQSSLLAAQKINIGNYGNSMQRAAGKATAFAGATGIASRETMLLGRITAGYTLLTQKKTEAEIAGAAATGLGTKALRILKIALLSTGIGALLIAFGSLVAFFKASEEGAASLQRIMSPFKILFGNIMDLAVGLGGAISNAFENPKEAIDGLWEAIKTNLLNRVTGIIDTFKFLGKTIQAAIDLDWDAVKENAGKAGESIIQTMTGVDDAIGKATKAVSGFIDETKKENEQNKALVNERLALIKREREAAVELANLEVGIQGNRLKLKDEENLSNAERLVFAEKAQEQIRQQQAIETELATKRFEFRKLENSFSTSSQEDLDEENRLRIELINTQAAGTKKLLRIESEKQTILKKLKTEELALDKELQAEREAFVEADEERIDIEIANEVRKQEELLTAEIEGREVRADAAKEDAEKQKQFEEQKADEIVGIATSMGDALGALASGQIKTFKDFAKEILFIALNALEKQILITQTAILAKDISTKGFLGIATAAVKIGLIKAAFSGVKGAIAAFSEGTHGKASTPSEFIAGEKGRELMKLNTGQVIMAKKATHFKGNKYKGATVYSNQETEKILSQATNQNNINFDTTELKRENKKNTTRIVKAINRDNYRQNKRISDAYKSKFI